MPKAKKNILIIEDDLLISTMYKNKLEADGFETVSVYNGVDGLKMAKEGRFDLIMLDIILPQLDGFAVLERLKKDAKTKSIPVIMSTNLSTDEDAVKGKKLGAADYFVKTNNTPSDISGLIKKYLNKL